MFDRGLQAAQQHQLLTFAPCSSLLGALSTLAARLPLECPIMLHADFSCRNQSCSLSTRRYEVVTESVYDPRDAPDKQRMLFNCPAGGMPQANREQVLLSIAYLAASDAVLTALQIMVLADA